MFSTIWLQPSPTSKVSTPATKSLLARWQAQELTGTILLKMMLCLRHYLSARQDTAAGLNPAAVLVSATQLSYRPL
jgi:hypothetical protein